MTFRFVLCQPADDIDLFGFIVIVLIECVISAVDFIGEGDIGFDIAFFVRILRIVEFFQ